MEELVAGAPAGPRGSGAVCDWRLDYEGLVLQSLEL